MEIVDKPKMPPEFLDLAAFYGTRYDVQKLHVLFTSGRRGTMGYASRSGRVELYVHQIWYYGQREARWRGCSLQAAVWHQLLQVFLHEVRHIQQPTLPDRHPERRLRVYGEYIESWQERDADAFAERELLRLATLDPDLFMPRRWPGYLGARIGKETRNIARTMRKHPGSWGLLVPLYAGKVRGAMHVPYHHPWAQAQDSLRIARTPTGRQYRFLSLGQALWMRFCPVPECKPRGGTQEDLEEPDWF